MDKASLETEKLRQEVTQLQIENENATSPLQKYSSYATLLTAIVAVVGVFVTIWKQFTERQRDREQRETESRRRLDEKFSSIIADIGSDNSSLQVSATVSLMTFLRDEYKEFHEQVYLILLANLKLKHNLQVNRLLIQAFEKAIRLKINTLPKDNDLEGLDLTNLNLYRIDLSNIALKNVDFAFSELELANLEETNLFRVKGYKTNFRKAQFTDAILTEARLAKANLENAHLHRTNLVSSNLKETNLRGAQFYQAKLQSAHLENSDLKGAQFYEANINDAYFNDAKIDAQAKRSIIKAYQWKLAHFDEKVMNELLELSNNS
jgi:uncharacterized protein YjbI with pentapeptide repeats